MHFQLRTVYFISKCLLKKMFKMAEFWSRQLSLLFTCKLYICCNMQCIKMKLNRHYSFQQCSTMQRGVQKLCLLFLAHPHFPRISWPSLVLTITVTAEFINTPRLKLLLQAAFETILHLNRSSSGGKTRGFPRKSRGSTNATLRAPPPPLHL